MTLLVDPTTKERFLFLKPLPAESSEDFINRAKAINGKRLVYQSSVFGETKSLDAIEVFL